MKINLIKIFLFTFCLCTQSVFAGYPKHWWATVSDDQVPSWEILPDAGKPGETLILSKRNELGILSNFASTPIFFEGKIYASLEGAWQSMKYPENKNDRRYGGDTLPFSRTDVEKMTGFEAKRAGSLASRLMKKHKVNYVTYKQRKYTYRTKQKGEHYQLIKRMMRAKLEQNREVKKVLQSTGKLILLPDHQSPGKFIPPAWKYYDIWMELRKTL